jgi:acyl-CoA synthetase (NDP forming)/GNAT superfamily N-acetyltransferase
VSVADVDARDRWAASVVLSDGATAFVRPITDADAPALLAFHERQPRENLYRRFFSPKPTLTAKELEHFTHVDFHDRVALVMELRGDFVAWASYERWPGRDDADVAFLVDAEHQGKGIATLLLEHLAAIARTNGVKRFTADVLSDNRPMLRVFSRAGWPVQRHFESGVTDLEFSLTDTETYVDSVEQREHRGDSRAIAGLLLARSIAVIGASDQPGSVGHELWRNAAAAAGGPVYPVNPRHDTIGGQRAYPSVTDIDGEVRVALIAVPPDVLGETIEQCIAKRVRGAIIVTSTEGTDIDMTVLVTRARRNGMRLIGAASMGVASPPETGGIRAALVPVDLPPGNVAVSMQSGSLGASLLQLAATLSMGISWFVSLGDKCDVSGNDLLQFWEDDETTRVIAMYTERFGNPRKFARIARRVGRTRPIVAVRTGAAAIGSASDALYQQAGVIEVPTVRSMLDTARVLSCQPVPAGPAVAILTNSRSPGVLATAAVTAAGLTAVDPPVALNWRATPDDFAAAVSAAIADPAIDAVLVVHAPPVQSAPAPVAELDRAAAESGKPVVAVMLGQPDGPILPGSTVPSFSFPEPAAAVLGRMYAYSRWLATEADATAEPLLDVNADAADAVIDAALSRGETSLDLSDAFSIFTAYGISAPHSVLLTGATADDVIAVGRSIGYPIAIKARRRRVGRSTEAGVALDLSSDEAVREAVSVMQASLGADASALIVQQMVPPGVDVRIRCTTDERLGPVVTVGLGSLQSYAVDSGSSRLPPVSRASAQTLVAASHVGSALAQAGLGQEPVVEAIMRVSELVFHHPGIAAIDINPLIVSREGGRITDARIDIQHSSGFDEPLRRLA